MVVVVVSRDCKHQHQLGISEHQQAASAAQGVFLAAQLGSRTVWAIPMSAESPLAPAPQCAASWQVPGARTASIRFFVACGKASDAQIPRCGRRLATAFARIPAIGTHREYTTLSRPELHTPGWSCHGQPWTPSIWTPSLARQSVSAWTPTRSSLISTVHNISAYLPGCCPN